MLKKYFCIHYDQREDTKRKHELKNLSVFFYKSPSPCYSNITGNSVKGQVASYCLSKVWNNIIRSEEIGIRGKTNRGGWKFAQASGISGGAGIDCGRIPPLSGPDRFICADFTVYNCLIQSLKHKLYIDRVIPVEVRSIVRVFCFYSLFFKIIIYATPKMELCSFCSSQMSSLI